MDLKKVKRRLQLQSSQYYKSTQEFVSDVRLIFKNCAKYNEVSSMSLNPTWKISYCLCLLTKVRLTKHLKLPPLETRVIFWTQMSWEHVVSRWCNRQPKVKSVKRLRGGLTQSPAKVQFWNSAAFTYYLLTFKTSVPPPGTCYAAATVTPINVLHFNLHIFRFRLHSVFIFCHRLTTAERALCRTLPLIIRRTNKVQL